MRLGLLWTLAPLLRNSKSTLLLWVMLPLVAMAQVNAHVAADPATSVATGDAALKSTVNEVSLDLVVRDKSDRAVTNLTPEDLAVTDDGAPVKLQNLRLAGVTPDAPRMVTLIFDRLDDAKSKNARAIAAKMLKAMPHRDFTFAVLRMDGRLRLAQQYTTDEALVERAIGCVTDAPNTNFAADSVAAETALTAATAPTSGVADRDATPTLVAAINASQQLAINQRTPAPLAALMAMAQAQRQLPGRKIVIYFTAGIEADTRAAEMVRTAAGAANQAGVSLYAIDMSASTLDTNQQMMATMAMGAVQTYSRLNPIPVASASSPGDKWAAITAEAKNNTSNMEFSDADSEKTPIGRLTAETGGGYIPAAGNLVKPIRRMIDDITTFYVATYVPPIGEYDGRFRPIQVKPLRKNISVRARSGYYALPPVDSAGLRPFELPLLGLLKHPQPPADIAVRSRILQMGALPGGLTHELIVEVPIADLELRRDPNAGLFSLHATLLAQVLNSDGTTVERFSQEIRQHGALEAIDSARGQALSFQRHFVAPPGGYTLELAILDANSGRGAVQKTAFDLAGAPDGPSVSDLAIVRRTEPVPAGRNTDAEGTDPLLSSTGAVIANLSDTVPAGTKQLSLYFMIHPGPAAMGKPSLEMILSRNGHTVGRAPMTFKEYGAETPIPYFGTIGAASLKPGAYLATVRITQGTEKFERSLPLQIGDPASGAAGDTAPVAAAASASASASTDAPSAVPETDADASAELAPIVVAASTGAVAPPPEELDRIVEGARKRALSYATTLPNFMCVELTDRSIDASGNAHWKHKDSYSQLLTYRNQSESRRMLAINGERTKTEPSDIKGAVSHGEFGGILNAVFEPSAHAEFHWKETGTAAGATVHVLEYRVAAANSKFGLTDSTNSMIDAAFHGLVSIDADTLGVRQVTLIADDLPPRFSIHATAIGVAYEYIGINGHDYLLPTNATVSLRQRRHEAVLNEMHFRDYHRFGSRVTMLPMTPRGNP